MGRGTDIWVADPLAPAGARLRAANRRLAEHDLLGNGLESATPDLFPLSYFRSLGDRFRLRLLHRSRQSCLVAHPELPVDGLELVANRGRRHADFSCYLLILQSAGSQTRNPLLGGR